MDEYIYPNEKTYREQGLAGDRWQLRPIVEDLKAKAKVAELWNLFLPESEQGGLDQFGICPVVRDHGPMYVVP